MFPDIRFEWRGWVASLNSLRRAGWLVDCFRNPHRLTDTFNCVLPGDSWYNDQRLRSRQYVHVDAPRVNLEPLDFNEVMYSASKVSFGFEIPDYSYDKYRNVGAVPVQAPLDEFVIKRWEYNNAEKQLIVPKETVGDLLGRIQEMQQEDRIKRIRNKLRENNISYKLPGMTNMVMFDN